MPKVDYYLTLASPYAYMGHTRFVDLSKKMKASVTIKPVDMGSIFSKTGGLPLGKRSPARQAYRFQELERWRQHLNIPLILKPKFFPVNDLQASAMVIAADLKGKNGIDLAGACLRAVWAEERNIAAPDTLVSIANDLGMDGAELLTQSGSAEVAQVFERNSQDALGIGVFGAPTYAVGEQLFWGQDRLSFLEHALKFST
ncbi:MAG: 2-hydroxychromene-2-carboxylate isomerase [Rhodospirillales bacterium]